MWWPFGKKPQKIRGVDFDPPPRAKLDSPQLKGIEEQIPPPQEWLDRSERTLRRIDRICMELERLKRDKPESPRIESFRKELNELLNQAGKDRISVHLKV